MTGMMRTGVLLICILVIGAPYGMALHEYFNSIDVNTDGQVSEKELSQDMKENAFDQLDADNDAMISMLEWEPVAPVRNKKKHMELFERMDTDRDKRISFLEFSDYAERHSNVEEAFMGLDKDRNNSLSPDELTLRPLFKMITIRF